jgi:superoxide dismutase
MRLSLFAAVAVSAVVVTVRAQNLPLPPLPYEYNALEPFISEDIMRSEWCSVTWLTSLHRRGDASCRRVSVAVHHLGHHSAYTDKLNV